MSVERGWGRDVRDTVQRRGEKTASLPQSKLVKPSKPITPNLDFKPSIKTSPKIETWMSGRNPDYPLQFKSRIEQKIKDMEANPEFAKFLAKKARGRVIWAVVGFFFLINLAPVMLPIVFIGLFFVIGAVILFPALRIKLFEWLFDTLATFIAAGKTGKYNK